MKLKITFLTLALLTVFSVNSQEEKKENPFSFKWDNGFKVESADKNFKLSFGGRIMLDHAFFSQNNDLDLAFGELVTKNGLEIRRARLFLAGVVYNNVEFKLDLGFEGGEVAMKDVYLGIKNVPVVGNIRVGNVKEPIRLEMLTSSKYITFMERSIHSDFSPTRNNGILLFNDFLDKRLSAQAGLFRNAGNNGNDVMANDGYTFTGRITGLPINDQDAKQLLHVGLGYSYRKPDSGEYRVRSRPEAHLSGVRYINTGTLEDIDNVNLTNVEAAFVSGPFSIQTEYLMAKVNTGNITAVDSYNFNSYYGQVSYFLTGESKKYKSSYSGFNRVKPTNNFGENGSGAWEVALRFSNSDLNNEDILGGEQSDVTVGLNWYLNPATRIMFNNVWADVKDAGNMNVFQVRFQIDF